MMKHNNNHCHNRFYKSLVILACAAFTLTGGLSRLAIAETPNPFGDLNENGSNNGLPSPPSDQDGNFGFPAPNPSGAIEDSFPPPAPPPTSFENGQFDGRGLPQNGPSNLESGSTRPNGSATSRANRGKVQDSSAKPTTGNDSITQNKSKPPQKLADYLELDSSLKGLEVKNFDLPDKDIKDVVTLISKWTGKNFILDSKVRGKITIIGPSQVTLNEAYNAFLSALEANGLTTIQSGKFIRIIDSADARRAPVKTYSGDYAPKDDQFITRIFQLKYINADEVSREFRDLVTQKGKLFAYEPTNSIIITDTGSNIQRIRDILDVLDVKNFETTLHVLRIKNSSSKIIADMLGEIYGDSRASGGQGGSRTFRRSALERTRGGGIISKIIPDEQTNSLIILANAAGFTLLERLVARLDVKVTDTGRIHVYYCEYAKAEDLANTLASLSGGGGGKTSSRKTSVTTPAANSPTGTQTTQGSSGGSVTAELEDGVKITSDASTNSLVIIASATGYKTLRRVLKKLDIPRLQVFVESAILEIAISDDTKIKVNSALGAPGKRGFAGGFIGDLDSISKFLTGSVPEGATIPIFAGKSFDGQVLGQTIPINTFMGLLNAITSYSNASILSTPQIIALDNEKATFKVQDEIPVLQSVVMNPAAGVGTGAAAALGTGNVVPLKTGIEINLTPQVNAASKTIRLAIEQTVDTIKNDAEIPPLLRAGNKAKTSRITNTTVVVRDQDYIMLGGLMSDQVDETESKVPLLGDIPILGWLFKGKTFTTKKTNLIILLRPRIIGTTLDSANLIKEKITGREEFIKENSNQDEPHEKGLSKIRNSISEQEKRGKLEPNRDYRNNDLDNEESPTSRDEKNIKEPETKSSSNDKSDKQTIPSSQGSTPTPEDHQPLIPPQDSNASSSAPDGSPSIDGGSLDDGG